MIEVRYSLDRTFCYFSVPGDHRLWPQHWMEVARSAGPVPPEKREGRMLNGYVEQSKPDGEVWHRRVLPFSFWKVKSERDAVPVPAIKLRDDNGKIDETDPIHALLVDYASLEGWNGELLIQAGQRGPERAKPEGGWCPHLEPGDLLLIGGDAYGIEERVVAIGRDRAELVEMAQRRMVERPFIVEVTSVSRPPGYVRSRK